MNKVETIAGHIEEIMKVLEIEPTESNKGTPMRVAKMWCNELFANRNDQNIEELNRKMKTFPNDYCNDIIVVRDIPFSSICEHHWLPFSGKATIGYVPKQVVAGLSKLPRVVKYYSKKPQLQEQMTQEIANYLYNLLSPEAVFVEIEAEHQCVKCRGAESDCVTRTYYERFNDDIATLDYIKRLRHIFEVHKK